MTAASASAQNVTLAGRLMRVRDRDTIPVPNAFVVAHAVSEARQGPVDSQRTDGQGRFRFSLRAPDTSTVYVVSSRYQGIGYFSEPFANQPEPLDLIVYDTSVTGPPMTVAIRHLVITRGTSGDRRVLDIFQVSNTSKATRVGPDSAAAVWSAKLPAGAQSPTAGEGDVPAAAVRFTNGRVEVAAPFPPGLKQVVVSYDLRAGSKTLVVPVDQPTERFEILVEDSTATASGGFTADEPVTIEGRVFRRYAADSAAVGSNATITFGDTSRSTTPFVGGAVALAAVLLGAGAWFSLRRRPPVASVASAASVSSGLEQESDERLLAQITALDDKFAGREADTPPDAWQSYQQRREALKAALAARVARRPS